MVNARIEQVRQLLDKEGWDGVWITTQANLSWLFKGRYFVNLASEVGVASVLITADRVDCVVNNIERDRLLAEEGLTCDAIHVVPWYDEAIKQDIVARVSEDKRLANDSQLDAALRDLRTSFSELEIEQYRRLGQATARVVESVAREFTRGESERQIAGRIAGACYANGIDPLVVLVAGGRRAGLYRHPLPTDEPVNDYAILSLAGRRWGLVSSLTRMVCFGEPSAELALKYNAVTQIDASMIRASRPGATLGGVLKTGIRAYQAHGFPEEWTHHHQGGLSGYQSREERATQDSNTLLRAGHTLAWNPTISGAKSEDTILIAQGAAEILTYTGDFPTIDIHVDGQVIKRPAILIR